MIRSIETLLTRSRIKHLSQGSLAWLRAHEDNFQISRDDKSALVWQIKPLVELIFLLSTLKRHGIRSEAQDRLTARATEEASRFDWHELAVYDPSAATPLALVADFFSAQRLAVPFDERFFALLNRVEFFAGMDRVPYREMDLAHCLGRVLSPDCEKSLPIWFACTTFGREQPITRYTVDDIYSLTHAIFYLTDMGLRPLEHFLTTPVAAPVRSTVAALTGIMLRGDNVDVLGELVLCWLFCQVESSRFHDLILDQALRRVSAFNTADGAVAATGSTYRMAKAGKAGFSHLYHTTLVAALMGTLLHRKESYANRLVA